MAEPGSFVLPEKWSEDLVDETGAKMSKRWACMQGARPRWLRAVGGSLECGRACGRLIVLPRACSAQRVQEAPEAAAEGQGAGGEEGARGCGRAGRRVCRRCAGWPHSRWHLPNRRAPALPAGLDAQWGGVSSKLHMRIASCSAEHTPLRRACCSRSLRPW